MIAVPVRRACDVVHSARDAQTRCLGYMVCDEWLQNSIINDIVCVTRTADSYTLKWITPWVHCMWLVVAITIPANSCALARLIHASSKINTFYGCWYNLAARLGVIIDEVSNYANNIHAMTHKLGTIILEVSNYTNT